MGRKYKFHDNRKLYFVTFTVVEWLDIFIREEYRGIIYDSLRYCQKNKGLDIYGYCIMTNHLHLIIGTETGVLSDIVRDFKSFTSRSIRKLMEAHCGESRKKWMLDILVQAGRDNKRNNDWQLWQQHNHSIELNNLKIFEQRLNYIHQNPVKAGFIGSPEYWLNSSAAVYYGVGECPIEVKVIEF